MNDKKYKLLIIDDEYFVVRGLRETIDWGALNIEIVGECGNGREGLEAVHRYRPDLVISDIKMPLMDGIGLAETLRKENFDGAVIFYSGYGDFEYARKAMECGVVRYMLKPIDNDSLVRTVRETLEDLEREREKRQALGAYSIGLPLMKGALLMQALDGDAAAKEKLGVIGVTLPASGTVIYGELCADENKTGGGCFASFYETLTAALADFATVGHFYENNFIIVTEMSDVPVISACVEKRFALLDVGCRAVVGVSRKFGGKTTVSQAYSEAKALRAGVLYPAVSCVMSADGAAATPRKKLVCDALAIIAERYGEKLTPEDVAAQLYCSVSHLMHELKEEVGKTFVECLTEYRILKAKNLLAENELRVGEIAAVVGFADVRYFGQVFRKLTGKSPKEYAESVSVR